MAALLSSGGAAQKPAFSSPGDALTASPGNFTLLLENEYVRVVEYVVKPGEGDQWHTHPAKVSYVAEGGTLRITTEDGRSFQANEKAARRAGTSLSAATSCPAKRRCESS